MRPRTAFLAATLLISISSFVLAGPITESVPVKLGPKAFLDGDVIQIEDVHSTSEHLEQGDTITVRGTYRLDSRKAASLQLLLTQFEGDGREETMKSQIISATEGLHQFEATITIKHRGLLHLTFYDNETHKPFGGVYFGTEKQMSSKEATQISH